MSTDRITEDMPVLTEQEAAYQALCIDDPGACNATAVTRTMFQIAASAVRRGVQPKDDPAFMLAFNQLCHLAGHRELRSELYNEFYKECRQAAPDFKSSEDYEYAAAKLGAV